MSLKKYLCGGIAAVALLAPASALAVEKGPAPTLSSIRATSGPYTLSSAAASSSPGFGEATVFSPKGAAGETFGAIAIIPGFTESAGNMAWIASRIASRGFIVVNIQPENIFEWPEPRGAELVNALKWLQTSSYSGVLDANRLAVLGHSMGGGGTFEAAKRLPTLKAAVGFQPWSTSQYRSNVVPQLIVSAENDFIAPNDSHSNPLYNRTPDTTPKYQITLAGKDHFLGINPNVAEAATTIAWLKRFVDEDTRYTQFLCPLPAAAPNGTLKSARNNCGTFNGA